MAASLIFLLLLTISWTLTPSSCTSSIESPRYFGTTDDVTFHAKPLTVYSGFTKDLSITCSFASRGDSDFTIIHTLIMSKIDHADPDHYIELAALTTVSGDHLEQKQTLGAEVSGDMTARNASHITFKWIWPGEEVGGRYYCEAHGWDGSGHPRISTAAVSVTIQKLLDKDVVTHTLQEVESRLDNCSLDRNNLLDHIKALETSEEELKNHLNEAGLNSKDVALMLADAVLEPGVTRRNHIYRLSKPVAVDIPAAQRFCGLLGGYLIEVDDQDEYDFATDLTIQLMREGDSFAQGTAIGSWDQGHEGNWTFMRSERPMTYFDWNPNEPSNSGGIEHCALLNWWNWHKKMNDYPCKRDDAMIRFLCEIPIVQSN